MELLFTTPYYMSGRGVAISLTLPRGEEGRRNWGGRRRREEELGREGK